MRQWSLRSGENGILKAKFPESAVMSFAQSGQAEWLPLTHAGGTAMKLTFTVDSVFEIPNGPRIYFWKGDYFLPPKK